MNSPLHPITHQGSCYSDEEKREAALLFSIHGSMRKVSEVTGIPNSTLSGWRQQEWWSTILGEVQDEANARIAAKSLEIIDLAMGEVEDRLRNGDVVITKDGKLIRKPVNLRDAVLTEGINIDKRQILMRQPTSITSSSQAELLAAGLTSWMKAHKAKLVGEGSTSTPSDDDK